MFKINVGFPAAADGMETDCLAWFCSSLSLLMRPLICSDWIDF